MTFTTKPQIIYQGKHKKLVYDLYHLGGQYKIYHKIYWFDLKDHIYDKWELVAAFKTLGEAYNMYSHIKDILVERDFDEWFEMIERKLDEQAKEDKKVKVVKEEDA